MKMNEVDLMPCPFCGGKVNLKTYDLRGYRGNYEYVVECDNCNIRFREYDVYQSANEAKQKVIGQWNTRKPMDEGIEKLKEEMVFYEQIKKETEEKDYRYLYHKIAEAYGKAVVIMHKSKWQEKGEEDA